jgi:signal recognition particle subunit SRP72
MLTPSASVSDEAVQVIATLNKIAVESQTEDFNPYAAYNSYIEATKNATSLAARPFGFQSKIIRLDEAVLNLNIGKPNATEAKAKEHSNLYPSDKTINVVKAAAQTVDKAGKEVVKKIVQMVEANPTDIGLALTLVQLRMNTGDITGSIHTVESLFAKLEPAERYQPGLVGLLVALYEHQGRKQHVRKILSEASEWWKQSPQPVCIDIQLTVFHSNTRTECRSSPCCRQIQAGVRQRLRTYLCRRDFHLAPHCQPVRP